MTKRWMTIVSAAMLTALAAGCKPADTHDADVQAIRAAETQWNQDYGARDLTKLMSHYADDAVLIAPGMEPLAGKSNIQTLMQRMVADPSMSLKFEATVVDVSKSGDLAYTQGTYTMAMTDPGTKQPMHDHGSYVTVFRKEADGSWKAVSDIATSAVTPGPAAPAKP
jgi:uncharacterized protein (TIGR02246 family)